MHQMACLLRGPQAGLRCWGRFLRSPFFWVIVSRWPQDVVERFSSLSAWVCLATGTSYFGCSQALAAATPWNSTPCVSMRRNTEHLPLVGWITSKPIDRRAKTTAIKKSLVKSPKLTMGTIFWGKNHTYALEIMSWHLCNYICTVNLTVWPYLPY